MDRSDYYELLGVRRKASASELRRAFRRLARKYHPEINPGDRVAQVHYRRICEAFAVLSEPGERERYDRLGAEPEAEPEAPAASYGFEGFDFSMSVDRDADVFPEIFRPPKTSSRPESRRDGEDLQHILNISFEESLEGLRATFQVTRLIACRGCDGCGEVGSGEQRACGACSGSGRSTQRRGHMLFTKPCPDCAGSGAVDRRECPDCLGAGRSGKVEIIGVDIPPGVDDGHRITAQGKGNEGIRGGRAGNLHVLTRVGQHSFFVRKGDNLFCNVPVTFSEAALGKRIDVPTPEGWVKVRVPAGVQSGQKLRLSGRGAPTLRGGARGDFFITIQVVTPTVHDQQSQEILRELSRLHPESPRRGLWSETGLGPEEGS